MAALTVAEIMDPDAVTIGPDADVESAIRLMRSTDVPGVPVVNEGGRCVGIVTEADLVIRDEQGDLHLPHYIELFGGIIYLEPLRRFEERLRKTFAARVEDLMTADPDTIESTATVREAAKLIAGSGHNRLPVVEHGRFVGLVTRVDVLDALAHQD
ncbi:CBS domain-containing protein [Conexibacter sp. W3-3-2]|uniref:CBS domain-containing protein n=1 Tax=Conexibacter sp. W3-3-2 TaxID=2675227 RepID=UPI0012B97204|nr:CBS domain-containing protein [Conexibacter sp. W3-3-2]MTD47073.1 CBS domain-containing protein [Conexibacter sp. W3-3-2]